jgi:hypothetical protein
MPADIKHDMDQNFSLLRPPPVALVKQPPSMRPDAAHPGKPDNVASPAPLACAPTSIHSPARSAKVSGPVDCGPVARTAMGNLTCSVCKPTSLALAEDSSLSGASNEIQPAPNPTEALPRPGIATLAALRSQVFGGNATYTTPFGERMMVYADYAASGRLLRPMEAWLARQVYPWFANVHSDVGQCACVTGRYVEDARKVLTRFCGAPRD